VIDVFVKYLFFFRLSPCGRGSRYRGGEGYRIKRIRYFVGTPLSREAGEGEKKVFGTLFQGERGKKEAF